MRTAFANTVRNPLANFVGYQSITVAKGATVALGVQFEKVGSANPDYPISSLVSTDTPWGAATFSDNTDQILVFTGSDWTKYFFYTPNARKPNEGFWALSGTKEELPDTVALKQGQAFFYRRSDKAADTSSITLSGGVVPLTDTKTVTVSKAETVAMAWPWPDAMKIKDFSKYYTTPWGAATFSDNTDQILVFTGSDWTKYFFYTPNARKPNEGYWALSGTKEELLDDVKIEAGSAFFFRRSDKATSDETISFAR